MTGGDPDFTLKLAEYERRMIAAETADPYRTASLSKMGWRAVNTIWNERLEYVDSPELFETWWRTVDLDIQQSIDIAAENFVDWNDYQQRLLSSRGSVLNAAGQVQMHQQFVNSFPRVVESFSNEKFWDLKSASLRTRKRTIDTVLRDLKLFLYLEFSIAQGRQTRNAERNRLLSLCRYRDSALSISQFTQKWNEAQANRSVRFTAAAVKKGIELHRRERRNLTWMLRLWIFRTGFPDNSAPRIVGIEPAAPRSSARRQMIVLQGENIPTGVRVTLKPSDGLSRTLPASDIREVREVSLQAVMTLSDVWGYTLQLTNPWGAVSNQFYFTTR